MNKRAVLLAVICVSGCAQHERDAEKARGQIAQALSPTATRVLGFESLTDWTPFGSSPQLALSASHTEGASSLSIRGGGWMQVESRTLTKEEAAPSVFSLDVRIPAQPVNVWWHGTAHLFVDAPSAGINSESVGSAELTGFPPGQFKRVSITVPQPLRTRLNNPHTDLKFRIVLNVPTNEPAAYLLDRFAFGPGTSNCVSQPDGNPCTDDVCTNNVPAWVPRPVGTACDTNATVCDGTGSCSATAVCVLSPAPPLDDGNPCTADACDPVQGVVHLPVAAGLSCESDGNVCNGVSRCDGSGACVAGAPPPLDDANPCTADTCDPVAGMQHAPVPAGTSCDSDANVCNGGAACTGSGVCLVSPAPVVDDDNACTQDSCHPTQGPQHAPLPDGTACNDGSACTTADSCQAGICSGGAPTVCSPVGACQFPGTCDPMTGACGYVEKPDGASCDDGNLCSQADVCRQGVCAGTPVVCAPSDACHSAGVCSPATGACSNPTKPDGTSCDDSTVCNGAEACVAGTCQAGQAPAPNDGNPCTTDSCDAVTGVVHVAAASGTSCDADSNVCNGDARCDGSGACVSAQTPTLDDGNPCTTDTCDPVQGVAHQPLPAGAGCSDGLVCNGSEACSAAGVCGSAPPALDDGNPCTVDACSEATGVTHTPIAAGSSCSDGNRCNGVELCNSAGSCQSQPAAPIDDQNPCTADLCDATTGQIHHDPLPAGSSCRIDECRAGTCSASGSCEASGAPSSTDDGDPCTLDFCDPQSGQVRQTCAPVDRSIATNIPDAFSWIYSGSNAVQTGVTPGAILRLRATLVSGKVLAVDGAPLASVRVSISGHPELGSAQTRTDGAFDLVVNGGGTSTVVFEKAGYLSAERQFDSLWGDFVRVPDLALIPPDPFATEIELDNALGDFQVAQGSLSVDASGSRQGTLLFPPNVQAVVVQAGGTQVPLPTANVRITEYTVGDRGPEAMPATLPATSGYTYAIELQADEAEAANAESTVFSTPLPFYVEDFLGFPAGTVVPLGSYDRKTKVWEPSESGVVLAVVGESGGQAQIDVTGDGVADTGTSLTVLGIGTGELGKLSELYDPGQSLWRVRIPHFSVWDCNWPFGPPDDAQPPPPPPPPPPPDDDQCGEEGGSIIDCESRTLREQVPVAGTPHQLHYSSERVPGRRDSTSLSVQLSGAQVPASAKAIKLSIDVAGEHTERIFAPTPDQHFEFDWNGQDRFGRVLQGTQLAQVEVSYVYDGVYQRTTRFGSSGNGVQITGSRTREEVELTTAFTRELRSLDQREFGIGGWSLDVHHWYDPQGQVLHMGDGRRRSATRLMPRLQRLPNPPSFFVPTFFDPDGTLYGIQGTSNQTQLFRLPPGGTSFSPVATLPSGAGFGFARGPDGLYYWSDENADFVRRQEADGTVTNIAGNGGVTPVRDNVPGTQSAIANPSDLAFGPDGSLYVASSWRVRRIDRSGFITTVLGNGSNAGISVPPTNGTLGTSIPTSADAIAIGPDGTLFALVNSNSFNSMILAVGTDGRLTHVAGCGTTCATVPEAGLDPKRVRLASSSMATTPDGSCIVNYHNNLNYKLLSIPRDGALQVVLPGFHNQVTPLVAPDGGLLVQSFSATLGYDSGMFVLRPALPELGLGQIAIPDAAGERVFVFDSVGRHLETRDAFRSGVLRSFGYDSSGRLTQMTDELGMTRFERGANGDPIRIVAPTGQTTTVETDAQGYLSSLTDPLAARVTMSYDPTGLLTGFSAGRPEEAIMSYDALGRLVTDVDAAGALVELSSIETPTISTVTLRSGEGRVTTYSTELLAAGQARQTNTFPDGTVSTLLTDPSSSTAVLQDGTRVVSTFTRDPRFGSSAAIATTTTTLPSGLAQTQAHTRTVLLSNPTNPLSVTRVEEQASVNFKTTTTVFQNGVRTVSTPLGRRSFTGIDSLGRVVSKQLGNSFLPTTYTYDAQGRVETATQGTRVIRHTYASSGPGAGYAATLRDSAQQVTSLTHDPHGRRLTQSVGNSTTAFGWDFMGNMTALTPSGKPTHRQSFTPVDLLEAYTPPAAGIAEPETGYEYDLDRNLLAVTLPGGGTITRSYDASGRLSQVNTPSTSVVYGYYPSACSGAGCAPGRLSDIAGPGEVDLTLAYDGALDAGTSWSGAVVGSLSRTFDSDFLLAAETVADGTTSYPIAFGYDSDGLQTCASPTTCAPAGADALRITYHAEVPLVTGVTLGSTSTSQSYNNFGEGWVSSTSFGSTQLYREDNDGSRPRDQLGRITEKVATRAGVSTSLRYAYDANGRLVDVLRNNVNVEHYVYDGNGNRMSLTAPSGVIAGVYDDQDRLMSYGTTAFSYTEAGDLSARLDTLTNQTTLYEHDELGNLIRVDLPTGRVVEYVVDGVGRRVGKKVDGAFVRRWLYRDSLNPVAELDATGRLVARFIYGSKTNVPDAVIRYDAPNSRTYRVISDHLGSPLMAVNVADVNDKPFQAEYTAFGAVSGTGLDWMPFGFAGGRYDPDTQLVRFGLREYDASVGRWVTKDPAGIADDITNLYAYADGDPVNKFDVNGAKSRDPKCERKVKDSCRDGCRNACGGSGAQMCAAMCEDLALNTFRWCDEKEGKHECHAKGALRGKCPQVGTYIEGPPARANSQDAACLAAKHALNAIVPRDCFAGHVRCICTKR